MSISDHFRDILLEGFTVIDGPLDKENVRRSRVLHISNRVLRYLLAGRLSESELLTAIKRRLPDHASIVRLDDRLWRDRYTREGQFTDQVELIFLSSEWPLVSADGDLPELKKLAAEEFTFEEDGKLHLPNQ